MRRTRDGAKREMRDFQAKSDDPARESVSHRALEANFVNSLSVMTSSSDFP